MSGAEILLLLGTGLVAGLVSTVVSLASLVSYPVLLAVGLPPISANVTNTVSLVFTGIGSVFGSRPELAGQGRRVLRLGILTMMGGAVGAAVLLLTPARSFEIVAPALIAAASVLLLVQPRIRALAARPGRGGPGWRGALFTVAIYVGYFGAAGGILLLVVLGGFIDEPLPRVNAIKNAVSAMANGVAAVAFMLFGPVRWAAVLPLAAGFLLGGWLGPAVVRRLPGPALRILVGVCGLGVAVKLGVSAYG